MSHRITTSILAASVFIVGCASQPRASTRPTSQPVAVTPKTLAERVRPSLVVVRYTYDGEVGRRDLEGPGVVIGADGLIAFSASIVPNLIADTQMIDFKVIVPPGVEGVDEVEYAATFLGRDERADIAFVRVSKSDKPWIPLHPVSQPMDVGDTIYTVGLLPKGSGYATYARSSSVSAVLRGPVPLVLTDGRLTIVGSPAFNAAGEFVGLVPEQEGQSPVLNADEGSSATLATAPILVTPIRDYLPSLNDPPTAPGSRKVPWLGVVQMTGLTKEVASYYGLSGTAAIQVGDVILDGAAQRAGLVGGEIITKVNGEPLERGDLPEELPAILGRRVLRMSVGDVVTLTIIRRQGAAPEDVKITLTERPPAPNTAARFYAEDLGYTVRDLVFGDRYARRLDADFPGVTVTFVKPQSNANAGGLQRNDVVTKINQTDVTNVEQFRTAYADFRRASPKESVVLEVLRGADTQIIRIQPPQ